MTDAKRNTVDLEKLSEVYDGEEFTKELNLNNEEMKSHLENWSLIGSALRDELPEKVDMSIADNVMAAIADDVKEEAVLEEQPKESPDTSNFKVPAFFKKVSLYFTQIAVAASVAMVTIVGWQTYSAGEMSGVIEPASTNTMGAVGGLNLASFQSDDHEAVIHMNQVPRENVSAVEHRQLSAKQLEELRQKEIERVNSYVKGYVLNTALK
ncbi:RseA family anti-sigma factor [uncultured Succinatimonas sp.]|uniref:sigma-E factor negative regulatory protein n=1 Tax=uncultured Succinatimonas sp. TaxID=1262973 RepID=UPI0025CB8C9D|nr:RseA family anti-sigma factor [uncultured Succinatimonas sp.]